MLFEGGGRTRQEPLRRGQALYEFYNNCGRSGYDQFRSIVNGWLNEMPADAATELVQRMTKAGDTGFLHGVCELLTHALLVRLPSHVDIHPEIEGSAKRPDFATTVDRGSQPTYVEVTTVNPSSEKTADENREAMLYNIVDGAKLPPGCLLGFTTLTAGKNSPPTRQLVGEIENWARDNVVAVHSNGILTKRFAVDDWELELDLIPTSGTEPAKRAIGCADIGAHWIAPHLDLRGAFETKSRRYGPLNGPYLIVIADCKNLLWGEGIAESVAEALFGDEVAKVRQTGEARLARARNGFWIGGHGPRNKNVSGILILPNAQLWTLRSEDQQPLLVLNPWADFPLPERFSSFRRMVFEQDRLTLHEGDIIADILGLPIPWPPEE